MTATIIGDESVATKEMNLIKGVEENEAIEDCDWQIIDCIDDALNIFGESVKFTIYWKLLIIGNIGRGGVIQHPELFLNALEQTFGLGAWAVEKEIVSKMKARFRMQSIESDALTVVIKAIRIQKAARYSA